MNNKKIKVGIIGAGQGQWLLCKKAKSLGYTVYCFAWAQGAVCAAIADKFYDVSIQDIDTIVEICRREGVQAVLTTGTSDTYEKAAMVCEQLGLNTTPVEVLQKCRNKSYVRECCRHINDLSQIRTYLYKGIDNGIYPAVIKPSIGSGKKGVQYVAKKEDFIAAIQYAKDASSDSILVEEYIEGKEVSVESISFRGQHHVLQITDKDSSPAPHFVELGHHQPAQLSAEMKERICYVVPQILTAIGFTDGPTHIELKYNNKGEVYLIEANLRGGGDQISTRLVELSSGRDYLQYMIEVALDSFQGVTPDKGGFSGIYFLCSQTASYLPFFHNADGKQWLVEKEITSEELNESHSNWERDGYLIYCSNKKIIP